MTRRRLAALAAVFVLSACGGDAEGAAELPVGEVFETRGRLSVADATSGAVAVWDLDVRREAARYTLGGPAMLQAPLSRQVTAVVAAQPAAGRIDVFGTGVWVWDHVEHFHVYKEPAAIQVDPELARDAGATALSATGGWVVAFDAATGTVSALLERSIGNLRTDLPRSRAPIWRTHGVGAHEGFALASRGHLFVTRPDGGIDVLPPGPTEFGAPTPLAAPCPSPTAGAGAGLHVLLACGDDLLALRWSEDREVFDPTRIALPDGAPSPRWLRADEDLPAVVADGGERALLLVDLAAADARLVPLDEPVAAVEVDRDGRWIVVATTGGALVVLDPADGALLGRVAVSAAPGPLALGDGFAYLGDPEAQAVHEVDLTTRTVTATLDVALAPADLVVTALWPGGEPVQH